MDATKEKGVLIMVHLFKLTCYALLCSERKREERGYMSNKAEGVPKLWQKKCN